MDTLTKVLAAITMEPAGPLTETTIQWGEDTRCSVCLCDLPASATAYVDGDGKLCVSCAAAELGTA